MFACEDDDIIRVMYVCLSTSRSGLRVCAVS